MFLVVVVRRDGRVVGGGRRDDGHLYTEVGRVVVVYLSRGGDVGIDRFHVWWVIESDRSDRYEKR